MSLYSQNTLKKTPCLQLPRIEIIDKDTVAILSRAQLKVTAIAIAELRHLRILTKGLREELTVTDSIVSAQTRSIVLLEDMARIQSHKYDAANARMLELQESLKTAKKRHKRQALIIGGTSLSVGVIIGLLLIK